MARRPRKTAAELLAELEHDPSYQARAMSHEAAVRRLQAEIQFEERTIAAEADKVGYLIASVWDFVNAGAHPVLRPRLHGRYRAAYPLLLRHLKLSHHPVVREGIIRALTVRDGGAEVWRALLSEFQCEPTNQMRWVLANALRVAMPAAERRKRPDIEHALLNEGAR